MVENLIGLIVFILLFGAMGYVFSLKVGWVNVFKVFALWIAVTAVLFGLSLLIPGLHQ
jgi:hypothetical protein